MKYALLPLHVKVLVNKIKTMHIYDERFTQLDALKELASTHPSLIAELLDNDDIEELLQAYKFYAQYKAVTVFAPSEEFDKTIIEKAKRNTKSLIELVGGDDNE